ncbi:hypothetical protein GIS00_04590 [Nakamurella sp. YIM 132087]|uniref:Choice-of-anchor D domain-containing protein n=1 Tax=Nakamurella alba TaxID=2665158 RepID=A0A7K1FK40_9ACTN|nr:hypothetical protein [Nakamurella alba]MTD13224.1 hypothetical protein [Nakamurella alba]
MRRALLCIIVLLVPLLTAFPAAGAVAAATATGTVSGPSQYLGDRVGTPRYVDIRNTGSVAITSVSIAAPTGWPLRACVGAPAGWTRSAAAQTCRFTTSSTGLAAGAVGRFRLDFGSPTGSRDLLGGLYTLVRNGSGPWTVVTPAGSGLTTRAYSLQISSVGVAVGGSPGKSCPPSTRSAHAGRSATVLVCGINHATVPVTALRGHSTLGGTFATRGGFAPSTVPAGPGVVVLGKFADVTVVPRVAAGLTAVVRIASQDFQSSPTVTAGGFTATNSAPVARQVSATVVRGGTVDLSLVATDADHDALSFWIRPGQGTITTSQDPYDRSDGTTYWKDVTYRAPADAPGTVVWFYRAYDGLQFSDLQRVVLSVTGP